MADTYYVDATLGDDGNDGLSEGAPWKTINKVNISSFNAGDSILFKRGETWREQLTVPSSGSSGSPITFGAYGSGADPIINGSDILTGWIQSGSGTIDQTSADNNDDGYAKHTSGVVNNADGYVGYISEQMSGFFRFVLNVPQGVTISTAYLTLTAQANKADGTICDMYAHDTDDAGQITDYAGWTTAYNTRTSATANWDLPATTTGNPYQSSEIKTVIQEIVDRGSWSSGNHIMILCYSSVSSSVISNYIYNDGSNLPILHVEYSSGNVYQKSGITTEPNDVYYNGTRLTENDGTTTGVGSNEWDWDSDILYVNVGENPDLGILEATQRDFCIDFASSRNYITIQNLKLVKINHNGRGCINATNVNLAGIIVDNCTMDDTIGYGVKFYTTGGTFDTISVTNNTIDADKGGIDINGASTPIIQNIIVNGNIISCDKSLQSQGIYLGVHSGGVNDVSLNVINGIGECGIWIQAATGGTWTINYNDIQDWANATTDRGAIHPMHCTGGTYTFQGNEIHDNTGTDYSCIGIYIDTFQNTHSGIIIRYNYVHDITGSGIGFINTSDTECYYNIVENAGTVSTGSGIYFNGAGTGENISDDNKIYNNIVIRTGGSGYGYGIYMNTNSSNSIVKNNIFYIDSGAGQEYVKCATGSGTFDNNCYWPAIGTNEMCWGGNWYSSLTAWQLATGQDVNSINQDPLFTDPPTDFTLQSTSPCIDAGTNVGLTKDYEGKTVPFSTDPDMGAYEYADYLYDGDLDSVILPDVLKALLEKAYSGDAVLILLPDSDYLLSKFKLGGVTKDKSGNVLGSCHCFLCKDNLDNTLTFVAYTTSDAVTGEYSFGSIEDKDAQYLVIAWKDDEPHVFDVTDHVLEPEPE